MHKLHQGHSQSLALMVPNLHTDYFSMKQLSLTDEIHSLIFCKAGRNESVPTSRWDWNAVSWSCLAKALGRRLMPESFVFLNSVFFWEGFTYLITTIHLIHITTVREVPSKDRGSDLKEVKKTSFQIKYYLDRSLIATNHNLEAPLYFMSLIILTSHQAAMYTKAVTLTARCQASASDTPGFDANPDYEAF